MCDMGYDGKRQRITPKVFGINDDAIYLGRLAWRQESRFFWVLDHVKYDMSFSHTGRDVI